MQLPQSALRTRAATLAVPLLPCTPAPSTPRRVLDPRGCKLDYSGMSSLVYTLSSVLGYRSHPTVPPDQELLLSSGK